MSFVVVVDGVVVAVVGVVGVVAADGDDEWESQYDRVYQAWVEHPYL